jgi:hypothetical protein
MRAVLREGFVDISLYVVLAGPSKNAACMRSDDLHGIFRKLRLAVFARLCRLPIGPGSLGVQCKGRFPILRCRMSGIANGFVVTTRRICTAVAVPVEAIFQPVFGAQLGRSRYFGKRTGGASDPPGWTCVLYLRCKPQCQTRHFGRQPEGEFWQAQLLCKRIGRVKTGTCNREVGGDRATQAFQPDMSVRTCVGRCPPGKVKHDESQRFDQQDA